MSNSSLSVGLQPTDKLHAFINGFFDFKNRPLLDIILRVIACATLVIPLFVLVMQFILRPSPPPQIEVQGELEARTVELSADASQYKYADREYDREGLHPPACTLHAVCAIQEIASRFDEVFQNIQKGESGLLSTLQKGILHQGLRRYRSLTEERPDLRGGVDLEDILQQALKPVTFKEIRSRNEVNSEPYDIRLNRVVDHLIAESADHRTRFAWLKNGNSESFAVIARDNRAIIFDSHKTTLAATGTKAGLRAALNQKLVNFKNEIDGVDFNPFAYGLGPA